MLLHFSKYQGAGNDFVLIDNRTQQFPRPTVAQVAWLCHRRFGIGADGLMLLESDPHYDFRMVYYNSDGREGSMCGNGGRCITAFAHRVGAIGPSTRFVAVDGEHEASLLSTDEVRLKMIPVQGIEHIGADMYLNTGSPHYVRFVDDIHQMDVFATGRSIRYNERFAAQGTNVNFVHRTAEGLEVATYERGVEDETLACGTGVVASSIAAAIASGLSANSFAVRTKGGRLQVDFQIDGPNAFSNVWLQGPATFVFEGSIQLPANL